MYTIGKPYAPRANTERDNAAAWAIVTDTLTANGGTATADQIRAALAAVNNKPFLKYCVRRGWLKDAAPQHKHK